MYYKESLTHHQILLYNQIYLNEVMKTMNLLNNSSILKFSMRKKNEMKKSLQHFQKYKTFH